MATLTTTEIESFARKLGNGFYTVDLDGFSEACFNENSISDLENALDGVADTGDMQTWGIDTNQWRDEIKRALAAKIIYANDDMIPSDDCNGLLSRAQVIKAVGEFAVDAADKKNCDFSNRVMNDGTVEFTASVDAKNEDGDDVLLTAYYYQDEQSVKDCELDSLDWKVAGYSIT